MSLNEGRREQQLAFEAREGNAGDEGRGASRKMTLPSENLLRGWGERGGRGW